MSASLSDVKLFYPDFATYTVQADGAVLHCVVGGEGPPLLLVHGAPQSGIMWRHLAPELAKRFTLIIPDLRGYGRSEKPAGGDYSKRRMAADLIAIMDLLGHEKFYIVGHDRGARVARRLVKDHEAHIIKAAFLDIVPTAYFYAHMHRQATANLWHWFMLSAPAPIPETIIDPAAQMRIFLGAIGDDPLANRDYMQTNGTPESLHAMCQDYRAGASVDLEHDAADADRPINVPILVAWGRKSSSTSAIFDAENSWAGEGRDITFRTLDTGHFMIEDAPDEVLAALLDFFDRAN